MRLRVQAFSDQDLCPEMEEFRKRQFIDQNIEKEDLIILHNKLVRIMAKKLDDLGK